MLYLLKTQPKTVSIAGITVGGHPGQYPTMIIAELFPQGDVLNRNEETGEFDRPQADRLVQRTLATGERTGLQIAIAVFGQTSQALIRYIDYVAEVENYTGPIVIDGPNHEIRLPAVRHAVETGLRERIIYDSVHPDSPEAEFAGLKEYGVGASVVMASNSQNVWPAGRLEVLQDNPVTGASGLLRRTREAGVRHCLVDSAVMGGVGAILAAAAIPLIKEETGLPVGAGTGNVIEYFAARQNQTPPDKRRGLMAEGSFGLRTISGDQPNWLHHVLDSSFDLTAIWAGGDYLFRIMHGVNEVMPAIATINAMMGYHFQRVLKGTIPNKNRHPLYHYLGA